VQESKAEASDLPEARAVSTAAEEASVAQPSPEEAGSAPDETAREHPWALAVPASSVPEAQTGVGPSAVLGWEASAGPLQVSEERSEEAGTDLEERASLLEESTSRVQGAPVTLKKYLSRVLARLSVLEVATSIRGVGLAVEKEMAEVQFSQQSKCPVAWPSLGRASGISDPNPAASRRDQLSPASKERALWAFPTCPIATVEQLVFQGSQRVE
jgi:hypothetical protein